jgi:hypothetical protein
MLPCKRSDAVPKGWVWRTFDNLRWILAKGPFVSSGQALKDVRRRDELIWIRQQVFYHGRSEVLVQKPDQHGGVLDDDG